MSQKLHEFKGGYARPFRANCKRCGLKKQAPIHDLSFHKCSECGYPRIIKSDTRCDKCQTVIDWSVVI